MAARSASRLSETESSTGAYSQRRGFQPSHQTCVFRLTVNEPWCVAILGYGRGVFAPGRSSDRERSPEGDSSTEPWMYVYHLHLSVRNRLADSSPPHRVGHNVILSHAYAVRLYREEFKAAQGGQIGVTLNGDWAMPYDDSPQSRRNL
jgi:beta-glucosidase